MTKGHRNTSLHQMHMGYIKYYYGNGICGVMVSVLTSCRKDCGCEPRLGQSKDYKIGICFFSANHATIAKKSKDWLAYV